MSEILIIMRKNVSSKQVDATIATLKKLGGRLTHRYPPFLILCQGNEEVVNSLRNVQGVSVVSTSQVEFPENLELDRVGLLTVRAWNQRMSSEHRMAKAARSDDGEPWDVHQERPHGCVLPVDESPAPLVSEDSGAGIPPTNTSQYLIGTAAVGVVIVGGPQNSSAAFSEAEQINVISEVQEGSNGLISLAPAGANLNFLFDVNIITLNLDPNNVTGESDWRGSAMNALGYGADWSNMYDYLHDLRTTRWPTMTDGPDWAYIAFFTKYATFWFAYASIGGPRLVMQYDNNGWGPNQIDRVFAHETGHIFGAPDEYVNSNCSTGGSWGYLKEPNGNCAVNNSGSIDCLMKGNTYNVCQWTVGHFGWRDIDADGVPDPIDLNLGTFTTDVGITLGNPFNDNSDIWIRNQDDGDINQTHQNPRKNIDNYIYVRVRNFGNVTAEVVRTRLFLADFDGTEFVFPYDYTNSISAPDTPSQTVFGVEPGASRVVKVRLRSEQISSLMQNPSILVHIECAQDLPVVDGTHVWDSNNLGQKNFVLEEGEFLVQEAEAGQRFGVFELGTDDAASWGQYVHVPNGTGRRLGGPDEAHKIEYTFQVTQAGTYRIKGWVYAANTEDDSFWVKVNEAPADGYLWDTVKTASYTADYVNHRGGHDPVEVHLDAGPNKVTVYLREDGTRLDKLELERVGSLVQEAEAGQRFGAFELEADDAASGGQYVHVPNGTGRRLGGPDEAHKMEYTFQVTQAGTYRIKGWVYAANTEDDSFWVKVNEAPADGYLWDTVKTTSYTADYVNHRGGHDPVEVHLDAGPNKVTVYLREDGTRLDKLELERVGSLVQEAEAGQRFGAFELETDDAASGGQYVHVPNGTGRRLGGPDEAHKMEYTFQVTQAGTYRIKGWVYAANTEDDSFWVKVNEAPADGYLWDTVKTTSYTADYVNHRGGHDPVEVHLDAGPNKVTVYLREDGTRLDKLELERV
ncbi:hypothetical protein [Nitrospira sp. M1]